MSLLIENLHAKVDETDILKGLSLEIPKGEAVSYTHLTLPTKA